MARFRSEKWHPLAAGPCAKLTLGGGECGVASGRGAGSRPGWQDEAGWEDVQKHMLANTPWAWIFPGPELEVHPAYAAAAPKPLSSSSLVWLSARTRSLRTSGRSRQRCPRARSRQTR